MATDPYEPNAPFKVRRKSFSLSWLPYALSLIWAWVGLLKYIEDNGANAPLSDITFSDLGFAGILMSASLIWLAVEFYKDWSDN